MGEGRREEMGDWARQRIHIKKGRERKDNSIRRKVGEKKGGDNDIYEVEGLVRDRYIGEYDELFYSLEFARVKLVSLSGGGGMIF